MIAWGWVIEHGRELGTEFLGGGAAYWTHHWFHRVWRGSGNVSKIMHSVRGGGR